MRFRKYYKMCHTSLHQRALFLLWLIISLAEILAEIKGKKNNLLYIVTFRLSKTIFGRKMAKTLK